MNGCVNMKKKSVRKTKTPFRLFVTNPINFIALVRKKWNAICRHFLAQFSPICCQRLHQSDVHDRKKYTNREPAVSMNAHKRPIMKFGKLRKKKTKINALNTNTLEKMFYSLKCYETINRSLNFDL